MAVQNNEPGQLRKLCGTIRAMKNTLRIAGIVSAVAAAVLALVGSNINAAGMPQDVNPVGSIGLAIAALAFLKASELTLE